MGINGQRTKTVEAQATHEADTAVDSDLVQGKESRTPACGDETTPVLQGRVPLDSLSPPGPSIALFDLVVRSPRRTDRTDAAAGRRR